MNRRLWELIPPDSASVLYFACGDGSGIAALRQRYPDLAAIGVETDARLRETAIGNGVTTLADAATALSYLRERGTLADAWILERDAWADETLTTACRRQLSACLRPGATLAWRIPSDQYWEHLLCLITGKTDNTKRCNVKTVLAELQQAGFGEIETVERETRSSQEYVNFRNLLSPLTAALHLPPKEWEERMLSDALIVRGRYLPTQHESLSIQTYLGEKQVCARVRIEEPHSFLATLPGVSCRSIESMDKAVFPKDGRMVWIWQRLLFSRPRMIDLQKSLLTGYSALTIQEWDDDPLHWERHFHQSDFIELRSAHAIQTSTPALAEYLRQFNPEVRVFPNCMVALPPLQFSSEPTVTVFYGALNRKPDWEAIMPEFNRVLAAYRGRVRVIVVLDREFYDAVECPEKKYVPFCPYPKYQELLRQADIALLPLLPTRFNGMKSDLKFIESAACGAVALASPTVYAATIEHGKTGWLYESAEQFEQGLDRLLDDQALRRRLAENAWQWVRENRLLSQHYRERMDWYESLFECYDELTAAIGERVPELRGCGR